MSPNLATKQPLPQSAGEIAILDAAVRLFSIHGYDGVSMRRIAEAAGVSKANIYHHFSSKEALYFAILRHSASELTALIENLAEGQGSFSARLQGFAAAHVEHLFAHSARVRLVLREAFSGDEEKSRAVVEQVNVADEIIAYVTEIVRATREHAALQVGVSPRAAVMLTSAARALAALESRDFVIPDDVKSLAAPVMRHRVTLMPGAEIDGVTADQAVDQIVAATTPPR